MILRRTVTIPDPLACANVVAALAGPGAPTGITSCTRNGAEIAVTFDAERTAAAVIDALIAIETAYVPERAAEAPSAAAAAALAAAGLDEPGLDATRIIETYLW